MCGLCVFQYADIDAFDDPLGAMLNLTEAVSSSVFAEQWSATLRRTLQRTVELGGVLDGVELATGFPAAAGTTIGAQVWMWGPSPVLAVFRSSSSFPFVMRHH